MSLLDRPPAFLVGAQRSGTTWLQRLIAAHPAVVSGQESQLFAYYLAPMWERWKQEDHWRSNGGRITGLNCYLTEEQFVAQMRQFAAGAFGQLEASKPAATLVLEKSPDHGLHLPLIRRVYPEAPVIHLVRDGRDAVASLLAAGRQEWGRSWAPKTAREAAGRWAHWVRKIRQHAAEPFLEVRYEDLLADGPAVLGRVFEFLRLALPSTVTEEPLVLSGAFAGQDHREPEGFIRKGQVGTWRDELSPADRREVERIAGPLLRELGYETSSTVTPPLTTHGFVSTVPPDDPLWVKPSRISTIECPAQMLHRERLLLYATVLAFAPERCLEIGVAEGWSSRIIADALRDLGRGRLVCVDPAPRLAYDPADLADVAVLFVGPSPALLPRACERAGGLFDFVLLDGDHAEDGVLSDLEGLADVTAPGGVVLAHDAYHPPTALGIDRAVAQGHWIDAGVVSRTCHAGVESGRPTTYAGFRLLLRHDPASMPVREPWRRRLARKARAVLQGGWVRLRGAGFQPAIGGEKRQAGSLPHGSQPRPAPGIPHGEAGVRLVGHREYVGGLWDDLGRLQFEFLVRQGLRPHHVFLDVGCGCLRGGVHFIPYLEPGHYLGLDKEPILIAAGLNQELPAAVRSAKRPRLLASADFAFADFGTRADFALAQSIFTHLPASAVRACLERLRPCLSPNGVFFATFFEADCPVNNPAAAHDHGYFAYTRGELETLGSCTGWDTRYLGEWGHPRGQVMMQFRPRRNRGDRQ